MANEGKFTRAFARSKSPAREKADPAPAAQSATAPAPGREKETRAREIQRVKPELNSPEYRGVIVTDRLSEAASQIRAVRSKLMALNQGAPPRVIGITSGSRQEGKTTMAFNLAAALSEVDPGRILLIDGDTLRPNVHTLLGLNPRSGLSNILQAESLPLDGNVYETQIHNLDVIPTPFAITDHDQERQLHQNAPRLIARLRERYSFVIVDTPPVMVGSQAATFGKCCDGMLLVAKLEKTPRHVVKRAAEELFSAGVNVLGCILTNRKHHVPNLIYRFFGTTPSHYYRYGRSADASKKSEETVQAGK